MESQKNLSGELQSDIEEVGRIDAVSTILEVVCRTTGMRFAAVARVTEDRWIACSVLDEIDFGLKPGSELKVETTICDEIRQSRRPVVIDNVQEDDWWRSHPTPSMYKFQSYISVPIILSDGAFFGTLCAIDPNPAQLRTPSITGMFRLFADLIAKHLDAGRRLNAAETALLDERTVAELREQFIAVLGHDLRTPVRAINILMDILLKTPLTEEAITLGRLIRDSSTRMQGLIDNLLDLARGRHGRLTLNRNADEPLEPVLLGVISELKAGQPDRVVDTSFTLTEPINCDRARIAQLFSNLLSNALVYGAHDDVVKVVATHREGTLELSVRNRGEQIPPAVLENLFQPFYRNAKQHNREGLGLGLYIAHEIAVAHRGTLTAESTPEETCFTLRIPA